MLPSSRSVLRASIADNSTSIGYICLSFTAHRLKARNFVATMNDKRFSFNAQSGAPRHSLHCAYDIFRSASFEFCSGSLDVATPLSDFDRQAGQTHFFGGIATNCLNNSKTASLSRSSAPFRTASSSPPIAMISLAFGKKAVLSWRPNSASRFWLSRQIIHRPLHIPLFWMQGQQKD